MLVIRQCVADVGMSSLKLTTTTFLYYKHSTRNSLVDFYSTTENPKKPLMVREGKTHQTNSAHMYSAKPGLEPGPHAVA